MPKALNNRYPPGLITAPGFVQKLQPRFASKQKKQKPKKDVKKTINENEEDEEEEEGDEEETESVPQGDKSKDDVKENGWACFGHET